MTINTSEENGVSILHFQGRLEASTVTAVEQALAPLLCGASPRVVWDLSGVTYIGSTGLRCVLQAFKSIDARGGKFVLCAISRPALEVFDISGFESFIAICPDRAAAVAAASAATA